MKLAVQADSNIGNVSQVNEDAFAVLPTTDDSTLLIVCDGMGGMGGGDEASRLAVDQLAHLLGSGGTHPVLRSALLATDQHLREQLVQGAVGRRPGCTATVVIAKRGQAWVGWAGDSRAYHLRGGEVLCRTRDHKLIQDLIDAGQITEEEAHQSTVGHVITQCLGGRLMHEAPVVPATFDEPWSLQDEDTILLCSDGLSDLVTDVEIAQIVHHHPDTAVARLVQLALDRGGHDNITVVLAHVREADSLPTSDHDEPATLDSISALVIPEDLLPSPDPVRDLLPSPDPVRDPLLDLVEQTSAEPAQSPPTPTPPAPTARLRANRDQNNSRTIYMVLALLGFAAVCIAVGVALWVWGVSVPTVQTP